MGTEVKYLTRAHKAGTNPHHMKTTRNGRLNAWKIGGVERGGETLIQEVKLWEQKLIQKKKSLSSLNSFYDQ